MQSAIHAVGSGLQTIVIVLALLAVCVIVGYSLLVFGVVAVQAFSTLGQ
jgi:hypothetical protein